MGKLEPNFDDLSELPTWGGVSPSTVSNVYQYTDIVFPPTISSVASTTAGGLGGFIFAMPFIIPDNLINVLDMFRFVHMDKLTSTDNQVTIWDGITGELIETIQAAHSTAKTTDAVSHVTFLNKIKRKFVWVGVASGIPGTAAGKAVTFKGASTANAQGLGFGISESKGFGLSACFIVNGGADWESPPTQLNFVNDGTGGSAGDIVMSSIYKEPMFCCLARVGTLL